MDIKENIFLIINDFEILSGDLRLALKKNSKDFYEIHSTGGFENIAVVISICQLIICIVEYPVFINYLYNKKIIVKMNGIVIKDFPNKIIREMQNNSDLLKDLLYEYEKECLSIEGNVKSVTKFKKQLDKFIIEMNINDKK